MHRSSSTSRPLSFSSILLMVISAISDFKVSSSVIVKLECLVKANDSVVRIDDALGYDKLVVTSEKMLPLFGCFDAVAPLVKCSLSKTLEDGSILGICLSLSFDVR